MFTEKGIWCRNVKVSKIFFVFRKTTFPQFVSEKKCDCCDPKRISFTAAPCISPLVAKVNQLECRKYNSVELVFVIAYIVKYVNAIK